MERRLTTILAADAVGYSRMMDLDEAGTMEALRQRRKRYLEPLTVKHRGRVFKLMGDGVFIEFSSAQSAVSCAIELQEQMAEANTGIEADKHILLRIGINLGDVMIEGGDLYGHSVNLAARLQELAKPGGVCVSDKVYAEIVRKLDVEIIDLGLCELKNIPDPVQVYLIDPHSKKATPAAGPANRAAMGAPVFGGGVKPSIVVLPMTNMSGDLEHEFFADGLTEDIITELSRFKDLLVISRNSSFRYKQQSVDVQKVAKELNVQYVVEGSVRRSGNRVRVTVQLIDAETDRHIWAERYDREFADIFAIQDEMTSAIAAILPGRVEVATRDRAARKPPENMAAYEFLLAAKLLHHRATRVDNAEALRLVGRAIALDPKYGHAHAWHACILAQQWIYGWSQDRDACWAKVSSEVETALTLDENDSDVHRILAAINISRGDLERASRHQERALSLNPNDDLIVVQHGELLTWMGQPEEGVAWIQKAMRLNPYHPERFWNHLGRAYFVARRYAEAIEAFRHINTPNHYHHAFLGACYAQIGDPVAAEQARQALEMEPSFTVSGFMATVHYKRPEDEAHHRTALLKASFPA